MINRDDTKMQSYQVIYNSEIIVTFTPTKGREAFSWGKKVLFEGAEAEGAEAGKNKSQQVRSEDSEVVVGPTADSSQT